MVETLIGRWWLDVARKPAPEPNFPRWLDQRLEPIGGPDLFSWNAALRIAAVYYLISFLVTILIYGVTKIAGAAPAIDSSQMALRPENWPSTIFGLVVFAPFFENLVMVGVLLGLGAGGLKPLWQCLLVAILAWWAHIAPDRTAAESFWPACLFFVMAWQYRVWAPQVGRRGAYLVTVATHAVSNGLILAVSFGVQSAVRWAVGSAPALQLAGLSLLGCRAGGEWALPFVQPAPARAKPLAAGHSCKACGNQPRPTSFPLRAASRMMRRV